MELIVSSVAGDVVNRFMSFLINKYNKEEKLEAKMVRLQDLLLRVHMIVEEAEMRYITNSKMLLQLKKLVEVMYQGYHILDTIKYRTPCDSTNGNEVSSFNYLSFTTCINQRYTRRKTCVNHELQNALDSLESAVSNMKEFALLLCGCQRMFCRPYDSYLYIDNFMFSRDMEKQQVINFLLQDNNLAPFTPAVLPVIGSVRVGKKTLVAHVCNNEKVRSHFNSILHLNGENIWRMAHGPLISHGRTLVVVEFMSDVDDKNWLEFYSSAKQMGRGSKIIVISRIEKLSRFGTVKTVHLNSLSHHEYIYLFKVLAFGSTDPEEHPQLVSVAKEIAPVLGRSFISANMCADLLRKNQDVQFWVNIYKKYRANLKNNLSMFGDHPRNLMDKDRPIDATALTSASLTSGSALRLMPPHIETDDPKSELPKLTFRDLVGGLTVVPKKFELVTWESRITPYKKFISLATYCDEEKSSPIYMGQLSKKRQRLYK